jgi:hypothetical protein
MKRSHQVSAPLLAAAALTILNGCRQQQMKRCVDEQNHVVDDKFCQNLPNQQQNQPTNPGITFIPYHYYYGGTGGFGLGSIATGGSYVATPGVSYTTRGGFGSFFGGGDSGGGHGSSGAGE